MRKCPSRLAYYRRRLFGVSRREMRCRLAAGHAGAHESESADGSGFTWTP